MKQNNLTFGFLALIVAVISTNAQERGRGDRDAQWAREAMERYRGSGRVNPLDPEAVKRRLDYAVKEGLMTREQAEKLQASAKQRMEVAQREDDDRRGRGRETQSNDRQDQIRKDYEARRKRIEEGVKSGKIKREDAARMYEGLRKWMEGASRGAGNNPRTNQRQGDDRRRVDMEEIRKRVEEGVRSGRIKREDAGRIIEGIRKRVETAQRGNSEVRARESQSNDRQADARKGYEIRRKRIEEGVKSGKIKREDAAKMSAELRKRMEAANRGGGDDAKREGGEKRPDQRPQSKNSKSNPRSSDSQANNSQSRGSSRGYLGVSVESSSKPKGLRIGQVYDNTAAARAKLKKGDIILKMNGAGVTSNSGLIGRLSKTKPGQKATLLVSSGGKTKTVQVQLGGSYSTRSSAQSSPSRSRDSQSSQQRGSSRQVPQRSSGTDWRKAIEERMKKAREAQEKANNAKRPSPSRGSSRSRTPQRSSGTDWRKAIEERMKKAREDRERAERSSRGRGNDRGEAMRKAWEERIKQWRESREHGRDHDNDRDKRDWSRQKRDDDRGEAMRKAIEERMKKAREDRERAERSSRGRGNDRGEAMRKAIGEWMERAREMRERAERDSRSRDGHRPGAQRGPERGRGPGAQRGPERGRGPQGRGPGAQRGPERGRGPQGRGPGAQRGPERGRGPQGQRGPQSGGPWRGGPRGR